VADLPIFPPSWSALLAIRDRIRTIAQSAGYYTDLGAGIVTTDPSEIEDEPKQPFTVVVGGDITDVPESSGNRTSISSMDITIEFAVPFADIEDAELLAHKAMFDLARCLRSGIRNEAAGLRSLTITSRRIGTPADGATSVIAQVTARAGLAEST
jgi:hypothetical protein